MLNKTQFIGSMSRSVWQTMGVRGMTTQDAGLCDEGSAFIYSGVNSHRINPVFSP